MQSISVSEADMTQDTATKKDLITMIVTHKYNDKYDLDFLNKLYYTDLISIYTKLVSI